MGLRPRPPEEAEDGLITAAQRGDRRAFDALAGRHRTLLRGFLRRRADADAVEDILQETWMAAWSALPNYTRRARFKAWLFQIALHKVQDYHRARGRSPIEPLTEENEARAMAPPDPYAAVDLKDAIQSALARLPDAQREVLELYYYADLTLPEIAQTLARNQNTVKYQFYRAHALVAEGLG